MSCDRAQKYKEIHSIQFKLSNRGVFECETDVLVFASVLATFMSRGARVLAHLSVCLSVNKHVSGCSLAL